MTIYEIHADLDNYSSLEGKTKADREKFDHFGFQSLLPQWKIPQVKILKSHSDGDFWGLDGGTILAISERSKKMLIPKLGSKIELLPVANPQLESFFYAINILNYADILDEEKSEIFRFPDNRILMIREYTFYKNLPQLPLLFKLENDKLGNLFATEMFKKTIEEYNLTGLNFRKVWQQERNVE